MSRTVPQAGSLRDRVVVERFTESGRDGGGAPVGEWTAVATIWAELRRIGATTAELDGRAISIRRYRLITRDEADIRPGDRLQGPDCRLRVDDIRPERPGSRFLLVDARAEVPS